MRLLLVIFIFISVLACRKVVNYKIPYQTQSLVVNSNFISDSFFVIKLTQTQGITENIPNITIDNALVGIYDKDTNLIEMLASDNKGNYFSSVNKPITSKLYLLKITNKMVAYWASDSVPFKSISKIIDTARVLYQGKSNYFAIEYKVTDVGMKTNNYGIKIKRYFENYEIVNGKRDTTYQEEWLEIDTKDFILTENEITQFSKKHLLFNNRYFNNSSKNLKFGNANLFNQTNQKTTQIIIHLEQYSAQAFEYYRTLNEHLFYQNDPFSQPSLVKGNIPNAYGAFVGKSIKADTIKFY